MTADSMKDDYDLLLASSAKPRLVIVHLHPPVSATLRTETEVLESHIHKDITTHLVFDMKRTCQKTSQVFQIAV